MAGFLAGRAGEFKAGNAETELGRAKLTKGAKVRGKVFSLRSLCGLRATWVFRLLTLRIQLRGTLAAAGIIFPAPWGEGLRLIGALCATYGYDTINILHLLLGLSSQINSYLSALRPDVIYLRQRIFVCS